MFPVIMQLFPETYLKKLPMPVNGMGSFSHPALAIYLLFGTSMLTSLSAKLAQGWM